MRKFIINYNTGAGNREVEGASNLEEVKALAIQGISYTQENISIEDESGNVLSVARWYGVEPEEDDDVLEIVGNGFYAEWQDF